MHCSKKDPTGHSGVWMGCSNTRKAILDVDMMKHSQCTQPPPWRASSPRRGDLSGKAHGWRSFVLLAISFYVRQLISRETRYAALRCVTPQRLPCDGRTDLKNPSRAPCRPLTLSHPLQSAHVRRINDIMSSSSTGTTRHLPVRHSPVRHSATRHHRATWRSLKMALGEATLSDCHTTLSCSQVFLYLSLLSGEERSTRPIT